MAKMFYTLEEVAQKLGKSSADVRQMADSGKLQVFRDGEKMMFKCAQVDALGGGAGDSGRITLSGESNAMLDVKSGTDPDLTGTGITIFDSDQIKSSGDSAAGTKMGTGFGSKAGASIGGSASGSSAMLDVSGKSDQMKPLSAGPMGSSPGKISVFDPDEVREADSMAATHANANLKVKDEDLALESVGSGSGLLDLTRETDDTSLGAELLDEIYPSNNTESQDIKMDTAAIGSTGIFDSNLRNTARVPQEPSGIGESSGSAFGSLSDTGSGSSPVFGASESNFNASLSSADTGVAPAAAGTGSKAGSAGPATKAIVTPSSLQMVAPVEYIEEEDPTGNLFMSATLAFALLAALVSLFAILPSLQGITGKITDTLVKDNMLLILFGAMFVISLVLGILGFILGGKKQATA